MNIWVFLIMAVAIGLVILIVLPRVRGLGRAEKTTIERRKNGDRRKRQVRVPVNRRRRARRAEDAAQAFVNGLAN